MNIDEFRAGQLNAIRNGGMLQEVDYLEKNIPLLARENSTRALIVLLESIAGDILSMAEAQALAEHISKDTVQIVKEILGIASYGYIPPF